MWRPGGASRFDYQEIDAAQGHLVIAHMNDGAVVIAARLSVTVVAVNRYAATWNQAAA